MIVVLPEVDADQVCYNDFDGHKSTALHQQEGRKTFGDLSSVRVPCAEKQSRQAQVSHALHARFADWAQQLRESLQIEMTGRWA